MINEINREQAKKLLDLARKTIEAQLQGDSVSLEQPADDLFREEAATFVTLKIKGQLRGCIGSLTSTASLWESIKKNAINAAFSDSRFRPLTADELKTVHIDISILTTPVDLVYEDGEDLLTLLRPGVDGVVLQYGAKGATFLPQVWEQLPTVELFLGHLCLKAGLAEQCWRQDHPRIQIYTVQSFAEEE